MPFEYDCEKCGCSMHSRQRAKHDCQLCGGRLVLRTGDVSTDNPPLIGACPDCGSHLEDCDCEAESQTLSETQQMIAEECDKLKEKLLAKNRKYGDSAINPVRMFSKADPIEQINVRIDDKLSRIANRQDDEDEDVEFDLIGYFVLKRVAKRCVK